MKKTIQFTLFMLAILMPATASAYDFEVDGIYYRIINNNEVEVTYKGEYAPTVAGYNESQYSGEITIPSSVTYWENMYVVNSYIVTRIGYSSFGFCPGVSKVTIPNSVTSIDSWAFFNTSLASIDIPNSVTHIGDHAYGSCFGLTSVSIPNSVTTIGDYAFECCSNLTDVTIPNSVTSIGDYAFSFCGGLTKVNITDLGAWCNIEFSNNESNPLYYAHHLYLNGSEVTNLMIPNSVTSIGDYAFYNCTGLTSIDIPNSVTSIGDYAFYNCTSLANIVVASDNPTFDSRNNCNAIIETATNTIVVGCQNTYIPNSVTSIGGGAFYGCTGLTSVSIPESVTSIDGYAFYECTGLTSVTIPNSVTSIDAYAFYGCSGLASVTIPNSVTSIGYDAFDGCTSLNDVYSNISDPSVITMGSSVFYRDPANYFNRTLHVPIGSVASYQADSKWSRYFGSIVEMDPILTTSIELNETEIEVTEGETLQLTATLMPEDATNRMVTWNSSNEAVATVDENGLVTAVAPGSAVITAMTTDGSNLSASCNVTVLKGIVLAESIQLNVTTAGLNEGATLQLSATVQPEDCDNKTVLWSSDNPSVATVDSNGLVTTHSVGTATITATTTDGSNLSTTCTVTLLPVGIKGDVNGDSNISIADVTKLIDYLLSGSW